MLKTITLFNFKTVKFYRKILLYFMAIFLVWYGKKDNFIFIGVDF